MEQQIAQQALYGNMPVPPPKRPTTATATVNGLNWSTEFAFSVGAAVNETVTTAPPNVFNPFMTEGIDQSSSTSPSNSAHGVVLTPPTSVDFAGYTHTPSPRSSTSTTHVDEQPKPPTQPAQWTQAQLLAYQQHHLQQQVARAQAQAPAYVSHLNNHQVPTLTTPHGIYSSSPDFDLAAQGYGGADQFTQQLLASMFPASVQAGANGMEQILNWRKAALGGLMGSNGTGVQALNPGLTQGHQPTVDELQNAVRQGMGLGLGMSGLWQEGQSAVEGF